MDQRILFIIHECKKTFARAAQTLLFWIPAHRFQSTNTVTGCFIAFPGLIFRFVPMIWLSDGVSEHSTTHSESVFSDTKLSGEYERLSLARSLLREFCCWEAVLCSKDLHSRIRFTHLLNKSREIQASAPKMEQSWTNDKKDWWMG